MNIRQMLAGGSKFQHLKRQFLDYWSTPQTRAFWEIALALTVLTTISFFYDQGNRFIGVSPHPYWIVILFSVLRYDTNGGLLSVVLSTLFLLVGNLPEHRFGETLFEYQWKIVSLPLTWLLTAFILGELKTRHTTEEKGLNEELEKLNRHETHFQEAYDQLNTIKKNLEQQLSRKQLSTITSYEAIKKLDSLDPIEIFIRIGNMIDTVINVEKHSVYILGDNGFEIISTSGWGEQEPYQRRIRQGTPFFNEITSTTRTMCVLNKRDIELFDGEGVLAAPIIEPDTHHIIGLLKVESLDVEELTISIVETFRILADWAGQAYAQAKQYQQMMQNALHNMETGVLSYSYNQLMEQYLVKHYTKLQEPGVLITMELSNIRDFSKQQRTMLSGAVFKTIHKIFPESSIPCSGRQMAKEFFILIPGMTMETIPSLIKKFEERLKGHPDKHINRAEFEIQSKPLDSED